MDVILELGLIIAIAAVLALIGRVIRQPPIVAYLITGIIVGPMFLNLLQSTELVEIFASIGVAFLLFIVGLSLDFRVLKDVGKVAILAGIGEIVVVAGVAFLIALGLGFNSVPALYLGAALAFSSTVVIVKLLSDKKEMDSLHGRIALGILIVEDFVAAIVLILVPILVGSGGLSFVFYQLASVLLFSAIVFFVAYAVFGHVLPYIARSQELLFLFSVGWSLMVAILFSVLGFSLEIGALLAGMALASSRYSLEIRSKIQGTRDFFVVLFFIFFGSQLAGPITTDLLFEAGVFSLFIFIGKPIVIMSFMKVFGYKKRTNFLTGVSLAQISEFSLIVILLGYNVGLIDRSLLSLVILISLITVTLSSYSISFSHTIYKGLSGILNIFDNKKGKGEKERKRNYDVILFGYDRVGFSLLKGFAKMKKSYLVVDYNPRIVDSLAKKGINCVYGDANDDEFLEWLNLDKSKLIISTVPDVEVSMKILRAVKDKKHTIIVTTSHHINSTRHLYEAGSDYVIMPYFLGGEHVARMLHKEGFNKKKIMKEGKDSLRDLDDRICEGHTHPTSDFHGK